MNVTNKWPVVKLSTLAADIKGAIAGGPFGSDLVSRDYVASGVPVIRGSNLPKNAKFSFKDLVFVTENKADAHHLNCAYPGDLVFTQRGTLGQIGLLPKNSLYSRFLISQSQMKMTVDANRADSLYLYNYFRLPSTVAYIENHALQSGVPHINLGILKKLQVICPPLAVQIKIAATISAYDDLIENNHRRIVLLEKMAEEIYREWFVRMRFPGHEKMKIIKGVPEGWRTVLFTEICEFQKGKTPDQIFFDSQDGLLPYITVEFMEGKNTGYVLNKGNNIVCENGDVLMLMDGARSGLVFRGKKGIVGSTFARVAVEPLYRDTVYEFLRTTREHIVSNNTGSAIPHANKEFIHRLVMFLPENENLIEKFNVLYRNLFKQMLNLARQNELLRQSRDALLPRLISGKLSVEHLDIQFPPGMEESTCV